MPGTGDLESFLSARTRGGSYSWCCYTLDPKYREQIEQAYARGNRNWNGIVEWLRAKGISDVTPAKVRYHFEQGHHVRT